MHEDTANSVRVIDIAPFLSCDGAAKVATARDGLSLRVEARNEINFRSLEEVFVMTDKIPWDKSIFYDKSDSLIVNSVLEDPQ